MKLWHDDVREAPEGWVWARTNADAKVYLLTNDVDEISMDHDLGYHNVELSDDIEERLDQLALAGHSLETGFDLVEWMCETGHVPAKITIHSWNPDGADRMAARFNHFGYDCTVRAYAVPKELLRR